MKCAYNENTKRILYLHTLHLVSSLNCSYFGIVSISTSFSELVSFSLSSATCILWKDTDDCTLMNVKSWNRRWILRCESKRILTYQRCQWYLKSIQHITLKIKVRNRNEMMMIYKWTQDKWRERMKKRQKKHLGWKNCIYMAEVREEEYNNDFEQGD